MNQSEVAQLYNQIEVQLEAMRRGMSGLAAGRVRHAFIRAQINHVCECQDALANMSAKALLTRLSAVSMLKLWKESNKNFSCILTIFI